MESDDLPAIIVLNFTDDMYKYKYDGDVRIATTADMKDFLNRWKQGLVPPYFKEDEKPDNNTDELTVVVTSTFDELVMDNDNDVFIKFYSDSCGHCRNMKQTWIDLANKLEVVPKLTIAEIDAVHNEIEGLDIDGYPTILLFVGGNKEQPIEFSGERSVENFENFLSQNSPAYKKYIGT